MKNFLKKNYKFVIGIVVGALATATLTYAATISAGNVSFDNTQSGIEADNVNEAINKLYEKANKPSGIDASILKSGLNSGAYVTENCSSSTTFNKGDYIRMTPSLSTFTIPASLTGNGTDQVITPNELTLWRVIKKNECGDIDLISEYTSSSGIYFKKTIGYKNYIGTLNIIANAYQNSSYTIGARMMGYGGQTEYISNTSGFDGSSSSAPATKSTSDMSRGWEEEYGGGTLGDLLYQFDVNKVTDVYGNLIAYDVSSTSTAREYWLASREYSKYNMNTFYFNGRGVSTSGSVSGFAIRTFRVMWDYDASYSNLRVRPILTLKSGITTNGGDGSKNNPYTLS